MNERSAVAGNQNVIQTEHTDQHQIVSKNGDQYKLAAVVIILIDKYRQSNKKLLIDQAPIRCSSIGTVMLKRKQILFIYVLHNFRDPLLWKIMRFILSVNYQESTQTILPSCFQILLFPFAQRTIQLSFLSSFLFVSFKNNCCVRDDSVKKEKQRTNLILLFNFCLRKFPFLQFLPQEIYLLDVLFILLTG